MWYGTLFQTVPCDKVVYGGSGDLNTFLQQVLGALGCIKDGHEWYNVLQAGKVSHTVSNLILGRQLPLSAPLFTYHRVQHTVNSTLPGPSNQRKVIIYTVQHAQKTSESSITDPREYRTVVTWCSVSGLIWFPYYLSGHKELECEPTLLWVFQQVLLRYRQQYISSKLHLCRLTICWEFDIYFSITHSLTFIIIFSNKTE